MRVAGLQLWVPLVPALPPGSKRGTGSYMLSRSRLRPHCSPAPPRRTPHRTPRAGAGFAVSRLVLFFHASPSIMDVISGVLSNLISSGGAPTWRSPLHVAAPPGDRKLRRLSPPFGPVWPCPGGGAPVARGACSFAGISKRANARPALLLQGAKNALAGMAEYSANYEAKPATSDAPAAPPADGEEIDHEGFGMSDGCPTA